jgi:hypothetical protein
MSHRSRGNPPTLAIARARDGRITARLMLRNPSRGRAASAHRPAAAIVATLGTAFSSLMKGGAR